MNRYTDFENNFIRDSNIFEFGLTNNKFINIQSDDINLDDEYIQILLKKYKKLKFAYTTSDVINKVPSFITHLALDLEEYNNILDKIPENIEFLHIGYEAGGDFNKEINNLPIGLKELHIVSPNFNQSLDMLPINLEILEINSMKFNKSLDNLPINLKKLSLHNCHSFTSKSEFNQPLLNLPKSLECLIINSNKGQYDFIKKYIPNLNIIYVKD